MELRRSVIHWETPTVNDHVPSPEVWIELLDGLSAVRSA